VEGSTRTRKRACGAVQATGTPKGPALGAASHICHRKRAPSHLAVDAQPKRPNPVLKQEHR